MRTGAKGVSFVLPKGYHLPVLLRKSKANTTLVRFPPLDENRC